MSGISSAGGAGFFSGIDTASLIEQLMQVESRPKLLVQRRVAQIQLQQGGFLDLNSKLQALKNSVVKFRTEKTFQTKSAVSSNEDALRATASSTAAAGTYTFLVDRLVSSQQMLSRGFSDRDATGLGQTSWSFENARARLDRDVALADLNAGQGVSRGKIVITDSANRSATVDLSRAVTVNDVLEAINSNGTAQVTASVSDGHLVIRDNNSTTTAPSVANAVGYTTADSLGLTTGSSSSAGRRIGTEIFSLGSNTSLRALNDTTGVGTRNTVGTGAYSFVVKVTDGGTTTSVNVNIGDVYQETDHDNNPATAVQLTKTAAAVSTVGGVVTRINEALATAGFNNITASIDANNGRLVINDAAGTRTLEVTEHPTVTSTTARDLGLLSGPTVGTINGRRVLADLNSTLASSLNGGSGITGNGALNFTLRDGSTFTANVSSATTLSDVINTLESASSNKIRVTLNPRGTGLQITDLTGSTTSNLIITGANGADTAAALGISTGAAGVAAASYSGTNLQKRYVTEATLLADNPLHRTIGSGEFRITDSVGGSRSFNVTENTKTFGDVIKMINDAGLKAKARLNSKGDGLEIYEDNSLSAAGSLKIKVEDTVGIVAKNLNIAGTAAGTNAQNVLDGSFERTVSFGVGDTLQQIADKINSAGMGMTAAIIRDGAGGTPYRLALSSSSAGRDGRYIVDTGSFDLGLSTLDAGEDALMFFGSADPARGVAVSRSSNTFDDLVPGLKLDVQSTSATPVTVDVKSDRDSITEAISTFVSSFNTLADRIEELTKYDIDAKKGGALLGDSTALTLRTNLYQIIQAPARNVSGTFTRLAQIGITVGSGGDLKLDEDKLRLALDQDAGSVEALFTSRVQVDNSSVEIAPGITARNPNAAAEFSSLGVAGLLEELSNKYLDSVSGILTVKSKSFDNLIKAQNDRITFLDEKLASRRAALERQFTQMELTIGKLKNQQSALGSLGSR